ncbi:MAG: DUF5067 domain-containing protein [Atopobium sp.]|nr:DUF5067 domain-containing protein [Atopobium sp.]
MSLTRREFIYVGASSLFALGLAGCGNSNTTSTSTSDAQKDEPKKSEEKQPEKYEVTIGTLTQITDYSGNPAAKITFNFTNNSDETAAFIGSVRVEAYQDGQQLEIAVSSDVDWESTSKKIKTGTSLDVEQAYSLISSSDVEVEVYPLIGKDKIAAQTFSLQ